MTLSGTLGYCPQEAVLSDSLTVGQHLRYFAAAHREFVHALADHHPSDSHDDMAVLALRTPGRARPD